ncbi:virulence protein RhuM/Fic/DOC family protein [Avibacterium paragallinarum]|uniref:virulence protein RhuM/Fic/DOC family protein n=1 Tax=Avibacterium paragallinarum TaxID=728 RepID=UPI0021F6CF89|nr:virulence protein RhuM/Fic/DOC family protein [Avibacterium paragallinarum]UXN37289.1 virulence protein RhuM/Fic/DOC family protein [Avibacterium paragallinarum]
MQNQIEIYQSQDGSTQVEVQFNQDTVWLSQAQMVSLFGRDVSVISRHIRNAIKDGEISEKSNLQKMQIASSDKPITLYDLDTVISVGYRVKSSEGVSFRRWATQRLKEYLVQGYTLNQKRLTEKGVEFSQVIALLDRTLSNQTLVNEEGKAVLNVVQEYARSWSLLQAYDEQSLNSKQQKQNEMRPLLIQDVEKAIAQLKQTLIEKGEATPLFANPRNDGLISAINTIEQGFGDELFYPNIASRAAHLLYFIIKNHPLTDGNKRTGAFLFLWYLRLNQHLLAKSVEQLINDNTLVALALLVAESLPEQKELMIKLIEHFILLK